jgi:hypothetical protein
MGSSPYLPSRAIQDILADGFSTYGSTVLRSNPLPFAGLSFDNRWAISQYLIDRGLEDGTLVLIRGLVSNILY